MWIYIPYILETNPRPNLIRTSFSRFLKREKKKKKNSVRGSNPHLPFNRPLPTRQTDWIIMDVTNALTVIRLTRRVWSGHLTASGTVQTHHSWFALRPFKCFVHTCRGIELQPHKLTPHYIMLVVRFTLRPLYPITSICTFAYSLQS